jgi:F-type H+-transporting ATPase subunit delta
MAGSSLTLARPYARAAFEAAREAGTLAEWGEALAFAAAAARVPEAASAIGDPRLAADTLVALLLPPGISADSPFGRFIALLASNRRLALLPEIAELYAEMRRAHEGVVRAVVTSAVPLEEAQRASLAAALERRFGRRIELETAVDPELLGGAVIRAGELVIDGSVRNRLRQLRDALTA